MNKNKSGRPTKYCSAFDEQARKLCLLGAIDEELANFFNVCEDTINEWKTSHPSFKAAMREGKISADANVAERLYQRAIGIKIKNQKALIDRFGVPHVVDVEEEIAADVNAQRHWLNNRRPKDWREKQSIDHDFNRMSDEQIDQVINTLIEKAK